ncbi:MAG TPA: 4-alpha-glucanotransferase [Pyrinomonadaceae bacterium]|nr:4-alpha-glucanotransferase [Pyrinomonadaceae bacterium]
MITSKTSGILLHPTSLPGPFGIGDLGPAAYAFADFLISSGQGVWQVLPLGPTGYGNSPYSSYSAFAGNILLISPQRLVRAGLLKEFDLENSPDFPTESVDFEAVKSFKDDLLLRAFANFKSQNETSLRKDFVAFSERNAWLDDYALYGALKQKHGGAAWIDWEPELANRSPAALAAEKTRLVDEIAAQRFLQFIFFRQWFSLKNYCNDRGIKVIGDLPIFVAYDSADVWAAPDQFKLNAELKPAVVAGVPPDYFSKTGQLWGNPLYNWERMEAERYSWWVKRMEMTLHLFDAVRMDHFRGFVSAWEIPAGEETAERGAWIEGPGAKLFGELERGMGKLRLIAEDLGVITPEVDDLRDEFGFPGMRVLQFGFDGDLENTHLPHNYPENTVAYTGTHDNDTTVGWFEALAGEDKPEVRESEREELEDRRRFCLDYLKSDGSEIHWAFIEAVLGSPAEMAIVPLQDVMGLGTEARMNLPGSSEGNWRWRFRKEDLTEQLAQRLKALSTSNGRA